MVPSRHRTALPRETDLDRFCRQRPRNDLSRPLAARDREGGYWVPIEGEWMKVPERAIIRDRGNPIGEAVVWYVRHRGSIIISCFVPADAV